MKAQIPVVGLPKPAKLPAVSERTLSNGLRVVVANRPGVPLVTMALRIPNSGAALTRVQSRMLEGSMMLGTDSHDAVALASAFQGLGSDLSIHADVDRLILTGSTLASGLPGYLSLVDEVIKGASYPAREVSGERDRVRSDLAYMRSRPGAKADEAMAGRLYGAHPYGAALPSDSELDKVSASSLRSLHAARMVPKGSILVLVGNLSAAKLLDAAEKALGGWHGAAKASALRAAHISTPQELALIDRPGSVQTTLVLAGPALAPNHADEAALSLANMIFGGYFSSRLVANIRERNGYTYSPRSGIAQRPCAATFTVQADVATAVTAPALMEMRYELARIATLPVTVSELESAKAYLIGTSAIALSTQGGVATTLLKLATWDLPWSFVTDNARRIAKTDAAAVLAAAERHLAPTALTAVAVGDAGVVRDGLSALVPLA